MEYQRPLTPEESRRMSLVTGVMWLVTFATSIPALWLFQPLLDDPAGYVMGAGDDDNRILLGAFLELLLIISNIHHTGDDARNSSANCLRDRVQIELPVRIAVSASTTST